MERPTDPEDVRDFARTLRGTLVDANDLHLCTRCAIRSLGRSGPDGRSEAVQDLLLMQRCLAEDACALSFDALESIGSDVAPAWNGIPSAHQHLAASICGDRKVVLVVLQASSLLFENRLRDVQRRGVTLLNAGLRGEIASLIDRQIALVRDAERLLGPEHAVPVGARA